MFCDHDGNTDNKVISDDGESSSSTEEEGEDDDEEDVIPEMSQYKEFLVSRQRRNLSRKCLIKRPDAQPDNAASGLQEPPDEEEPEIAGSQEEEEAPQNNEEQVRKTRGEEW